MQSNMMAKGLKPPGAFPDPLGPILVDRGGPRAASGPKDTKPNSLAIFDEVNEKMDIKSELKMAKGRPTTTTMTKATTVQQLSSANAHQGWREDNETAYPFYQNDNRYNCSDNSVRQLVA